MARFDSVRVHAIILTQDRTDVLERSVDTAVMKLRPCDVLTVLDDSRAGIAEENAILLNAVARQSSAIITHLMPARLYEAIADVTDGSALEWQSRTARRDIAPLRNLALLLSAAVRAGTTVLIDDDICDFDLEVTHKRLGQLVTGSQGLVVGAEISGQSEMDTLTRVCDVIQRRESRQVDCKAALAEHYHLTGSSHGARAVDCGWVSAGYMAFKLHPTQMFAFPPGYNEDWLWCLMHSISGEVRVVRSEQVVRHDPPELRRSTHCNILFELAGDLVFDCLRVYHEGEKRTPLATLCALARHTPNPEVLPTTRVDEVMELARQSTSIGGMQSCLNDNGLSALQELIHTGHLCMSERTILPDWCNDAVAKHWAYSSLPASEAVQSVMATMMLAGRK